MLPVFSSTDGRTVIGMANGVRSAGVLIRKAITIDPQSTLHVWQRSKADIDMTDILDLPDGFCYAISYRY